MTNPATGATGAAGANGATGTSAPARTAKKDLDKDGFLKLLVAQLKYQDPNAPMDNTQLMTQTAQLTMVEKLTSLATDMQSLLTAQTLFGASSLVGRTVAYVDDKGATQTGVVKSSTINGSSPILKVGNTDVPLSSVTEVQATAG